MSNASGFMLQRAIQGFGPFKSAEDSAREALKGRTAQEAVRHLIRNHCLVAGGQGFATGLGGVIAMPVTLPANIGASYLVQAHLAASIARVYGWDEHSEEVRTAILLCLVGNAGTTLLAKHGSRRATARLVRGVPLVGGIVGGGVDLAATRAVGHFADRFFRPDPAA